MTQNGNGALNFGGDQLEREQFTERLIQYIVGLADSDSAILPAGRVIAVNAPWGAGKTWVAKRLATQLQLNQQIRRPGIYVNAFEFDFHQDPFAVLASAILSQASDTSGAKAGLKEATKTVLKESLPVLLKGAMRTGAKKLVGEEAYEDVVDSLVDGTEKTLEALVDTFAATQKSGQAFREKLTEFAHSTQGPLVVIVDELDRCQPTFALDLLERVKHLFDVPNIVFVLFFHRDAMASVIRQMYGSGIDTDAYLRKFISLNVDLPSKVPHNYNRDDAAHFVQEFLRSSFPASKRQNEAQFLEGLAELAPLFQATLRDVQTVMLMRSLLGPSAHEFGAFGAYVLLLRLFAPHVLEGLRQREASAFKSEVARLQSSHPETRRPAWFQGLRTGLAAHGEPAIRDALQPLQRERSDQVIDELVRAAHSLSLEHLKL